MSASNSPDPEAILSTAENTILVEEDFSGNFFKVFDEALKLIPAENARHEQVFWERAAFVHMYYLEPTIVGGSKLSVAGIEAFRAGLLKEGLVNPDKAVAYLKLRAESTMNPFYRAKFSFTLWHVTKRPEYATTAVKAYVDCARKQLGNKQYGDVFHKFMTAMFIAKLPGYESARKDLGTALVPLCTGLANSNNFGLSLLILQTAIFLSGDIPPADLPKLAEWASTTSASLRAKQEFRLAREFLSVAGQLQKNGSTAMKQTLQQIALMHEEEASKAIQDGNPSAMFFCYEAANAFQRSGDSAKYKEMLSKAAKATSLIQYNQHEETFELPNLEIIGSTPEEIYREIGSWTGVDPQPDAINGVVSSLAGANALSNTMIRVIESGGYPIAIGAGEDFEKLESEIFWIVLQESRMCAAVANLEENGRVDAASLNKFLSLGNVVSKDTLELTSEGVKEHFDKRYIASCHIFLPQIEATLRTMLETSNVPVAKQEEGGIRSKELGGLLTDEKVREFLGHGFAAYLYAKLANPKALNQRNLALHGLMESKHFNQNLSISCIYILLRFLAMGQTPVASS